jgi:hypothetical protein
VGQYIAEKSSAEFGATLSYDPREHVRLGRAYPASAPRRGKSWETGIEQDKATARNQEIAPSSVEYKGEEEPEGEIARHPQGGDCEKSEEGTS